MDLTKALTISASGLTAQGTRMRVIAENLANANSTSSTSGDPYRRKVISFKSELDKQSGVNVVAVDRIGLDESAFGKRYDPGHPSANADGYIKTSNVRSLIESMDMREAQRSYEANLNMISVTKDMLQRTIELLR
jgi:flagellar basal-body rod protein FlgC